LLAILDTPENSSVRNGVPLRPSTMVYQDQDRDTDAARIQQQLDDLDKRDGDRRDAASTGE
jgi:hypothetical protein